MNNLPTRKDAAANTRAHQPDDDSRRKVRTFAMIGATQKDIARVLRIDPKTLRKHYADELQLGSIEASASIGGKLFALAMEGNVAACIFWMKCRAGWREKADPVVAVSGEDSTGVVIQIVANGEKPEDEGLVTADEPIEGYGRSDDDDDGFDAAARH